MVKTGGGASINASKVTSKSTSEVISKSTFTAAAPYKEGGIGIKFSNIASASCSEG
jgi:hypothetical protein